MAAMETNDHLIDSAVDMNYIAPDVAAKMKLDWRNDTAAAKIEMMEPEERTSHLMCELSSCVKQKPKAN